MEPSAERSISAIEWISSEEDAVDGLPQGEIDDSGEGIEGAPRRLGRDATGLPEPSEGCVEVEIGRRPRTWRTDGRRRHNGPHAEPERLECERCPRGNAVILDEQGQVTRRLELPRGVEARGYEAVFVRLGDTGRGRLAVAGMLDGPGTHAAVRSNGFVEVMTIDALFGH